MINYYDPEGLMKARYTVKLTYLFGNTKIIALDKVVCHGSIYGADVLNGYTETTFDYPFSEFCTFENGKIVYDGEILIYNKDNEEIASYCDAQELQSHLIGVEIIKVEDLEEE